MASAPRTVEEVLREGGFTAFHRRIVAITGFAWTFVAFEIIIIGFVLAGPTGIFATFGINQNAQPTLYFLVASATLIGSFIGSLVLGRLADARGRRTVFLVDRRRVRDLQSRNIHRDGPASVRRDRLRDPPRIVRGEPLPRTALGRAGPTDPVPGVHPHVLAVHGPHRPLVQHLERVPPAVPRRTRPRRDARDRPRRALRIPPAAAPGPLHGVPGLLLARRLPAGDRVLVPLHHPAGRRLAPPFRRRRVPRVHRVPVSADRPGEPILPRPPRPAGP